MKCVVLVGGEGTRLRPLTYTTPKQMLPIVEMAMLERVLLRLGAAGVDLAVLSLGYKPDAFVAAYPEAKACGVNLVYAVEPEPLDTAGAIRFAAEAGGIDETFLAVNGDVLTDAPLGQLVELHRKRDAEATVALTPVEDPSAFGVVDADARGKVIAFVEKPAPGTAPTNLINAGTYVLEPEVLKAIPAGRRVSIEREIFPDLAARGCMYACPSEAYWLDTGTPSQYLSAHRDLLTGKRGSPPHPHARLTGADEGGELWVVGDCLRGGRAEGASLAGQGARFAAGSLLEFATVGARSRVGEGAVIRNSVLMAGADVGKDAVVESSIIGFEASVGEGARVTGTSVIGAGFRVPAGAVLEGARLPE